MLRQLLSSRRVSIGNIVIHALVMTAVVRVAHRVAARNRSPRRLLISVMVATVSVLMAAHLSQRSSSGHWPMHSLDAARPVRTHVFRLRELHHARLRRRHSVELAVRGR